jgi:FtsH-binding integral membrane protein
MFNRDPRQQGGFQSGQPGRPASPFGFPAGAGTYGTAITGVRAREGFLTASFVWMFMALIASAVAAGFVLSNAGALTFVVKNYFILFIGAFIVAMVVQMGINKIGFIPALAGLFAYSVLMGATLGAIVAAYSVAGGFGAVVSAFLGASAIFGAAALYGVVTKRDLTRLGGILFVAFIGLFVMSLVNLFVGGSTLSFVIGAVGVVIFTGLTAYYVQQLNSGGLDYIANRDSASVVGALVLYILFINLFLMLLRVLGGNRN